MNWCKRHNDNFGDIIFSDKWTYSLNSPGGMRWVIKHKQNIVLRTKYTRKIYCRGAFLSNGKNGFELFGSNFDINYSFKFLKLVYLK